MMTKRMSKALLLATMITVLIQTGVRAQAPNPDNNVYFGDVHVHTGWSFDAFTNGSQTTPMDAYAWAQGNAPRFLHGCRSC